MNRKSDKVKRPKDGKITRVLIVARISTDKQDPRSLEDQEAYCRKEVKDQYEGQISFEVIQSVGSGEHLDRKELDELKDAIESGKIDVVITEDLGRICRRNRALDFCELCEDEGTRLIAINDRVDTNEAAWRDAAMMATWHHERSNRDTSERIKRSLSNRFDLGQLMESMIFGYVVPDGATNDSQVYKDSTAEPIIIELFRRLEEGANYSEIADWLNQHNVPLGPYCKAKRWSCGIVSRFVHNRLLKGERVRNRLYAKRHNKSGRHRAVKAPAEMLRIRKCTHLAYFEPAYYDHVIAMLDARNAKYRREKPGKPDERTGVARSRTAWPGQHIRCGVCGRQMYWTKCGDRKAMICSGAQNYQCWNSLILAAQVCIAKVNECVLRELRLIPDFDRLLTDAVAQILKTAPEDRLLRRKELERQLKAAQGELDNIVEAVAKGFTGPTFLERAQSLQTQIDELNYQIGLTEKAPNENLAVPTQDEVVALLEEIFSQTLADDQDAIRLLRRLIPRMYLLPYRCCDDKGVECRVHLTINLSPLLGVADGLPGVDQIVTRELIVDAFDPPQKVKYLEAVITQRSLGLTERQIAAAIGITQPAVQHTLKLARRMRELGTSEPYFPLLEVPTVGKSKFRRHLHVRFKFEPLDGFPMI
ncbi:MAG: Recombinase [Planctomycetaceae bacterium]|nr:Recombinase [Planctomycetaceae bacterium]